MEKLQLPFVKLPAEFVTLLVSNLSVTTSSAPIFDIIRPSRSLMLVLENAFREFDDGRGVEKLLTALGWSNFRDRMGSLFIYKAIYGNFPNRTQMEFVDEIKFFESQYADQSVHGYSRLFLLGFYLKLANIQLQQESNNQFMEIKIPSEVMSILKLSQGGRTEKIDWLILITTHLVAALGEKMLSNLISSGKKIDEIYELMSNEARENMFQNLLSYGTSINEADFFLYEKV